MLHAAPCAQRQLSIKDPVVLKTLVQQLNLQPLFYYPSKPSTWNIKYVWAHCCVLYSVGASIHLDSCSRNTVT